MEPFETNPKNQILAKFGQNVGLIWPILKKLNLIYFASENGIFKILHILKHLTEIWREAHLAKWPNLGQNVPYFKNTTSPI